MLNYSITFIVMHLAVISNGKSCKERTSPTSPRGNSQNCNDNIDIYKQSASQTMEKRKKSCCPYDFDSSLCRTVNDRVLCGYDKNIGEPGAHDSDRDLGRNCRMRNGRVECGYWHPPYTPIRRPPARDEDPFPYVHQEEVVAELVTPDLMPPKGDLQNNDLVILQDDPKKQEELNPKVYLKQPSQTKIIRYKPRKCVEIGDRVVCKPYK